MNRGIVLSGLAVAVLVALPTVAQQPPACTASHGSLDEGAFAGFENTVPLPPCAEPSLPPLTTRPIPAKAPSVNPPPAGPPQIADHRVASTDLGFERGIGPAPGWGVVWQGRICLVVDVTASDGRPTFAGGSRFIITTEGGALDVGLKAVAKGARAPEMVSAMPIVN